MRYLYTLTRIEKKERQKKNLTISHSGRIWNNQNSCTLLVECKMIQLLIYMLMNEKNIFKNPLALLEGM